MITVVAPNVAPVNTVPGSQSTVMNTAKVFSTANSNALSVADSDAGLQPDPAPGDQHQRHVDAVDHVRTELHRWRQRHRDDDVHRHADRHQHRPERSELRAHDRVQRRREPPPGLERPRDTVLAERRATTTRCDHSQRARVRRHDQSHAGWCTSTAWPRLRAPRSPTASAPTAAPSSRAPHTTSPARSPATPPSTSTRPRTTGKSTARCRTTSRSSSGSSRARASEPPPMVGRRRPR